MGGTELIGKREEELVLDVIRRGKIFRYAYGEKEKTDSYAWRFEKEFADFLGAGHACAVSSGSAALLCGLHALGVTPGSEVILPAYTFVATAEAVIEAGARPVLAEIDETLNIDPGDIEKKITPRTSALIPVHMMGAAARMDRVMEIAAGRKIAVLEDACQAVGATWQGRYAGTIGDAGTFSFDSAKLLTCSEGGMLVTNNPETWRRADRYQDHGHVHDLSLPRGREAKEGKGFNLRLSELLAAFGLAQLEKLPEMLSTLRRNRDGLRERLKLAGGFRYRPLADEGEIATFLCLVAPDRDRADRAREILSGAGVPAATLNYWHYEVNREIAGGAFPRTEDHLARAIVLEIRLTLRESDLDRMADALNRAMAA